MQVRDEAVKTTIDIDETTSPPKTKDLGDRVRDYAIRAYRAKVDRAATDLFDLDHSPHMTKRRQRNEIVEAIVARNADRVAAAALETFYERLIELVESPPEGIDETL
jgi:hypothetical protein